MGYSIDEILESAAPVEASDALITAGSFPRFPDGLDA